MKDLGYGNDYRSVGDCKRAYYHYTRGLYFESLSEANKVLSFFENQFEFCVRPWIKVVYRRTTRKSADVCLFDGKIRLFPKGFRVSTLIHELAHLEGVSGHHNHGKDFKKAQDKLLRYYEAHWANPDRQVELPKVFGTDLAAPKPRLDKSDSVCHTYVTKSGFHTTHTHYGK